MKQIAFLCIILFCCLSIQQVQTQVIDPDFMPHFFQEASVYDCLVLPDDKIIVSSGLSHVGNDYAGSSSFSLKRLLPDGKQLYLSVRLATDNDIRQLIRVNMPLLNPVQEQRYDLNNSMRVFPNPISDEVLNLQFIDAQLGKQFNYQITEIATGRIIKNGQLNASSNNTIMVADLQKGFYLLQV